RDLLAGQGAEVEALAAEVDGKFVAAFVRATKPAAGAVANATAATAAPTATAAPATSCCAPSCCGGHG
ncbi:MAG: hypothetical protein MUF32_02530, partial [Burkholderiaceae bacterium]|nr:hypothetical protein [Burkholderiaceae bacterium]